MRGWEANHQLRSARERTESPYATGQPLSRQELADLVNTWLWENKGRVSELDANYIGKLEQGRIRWPQDPDRRAAFRAVLRVRTDTELGFRRPRRLPATLDDVDRKQFLYLALGAGAGAAAGRFHSTVLGPSDTPAPPVTVGAVEVDQVNALARQFAAWDHAHGGGLVWQAVSAQLSWSASLLSARCPARLRPALFAAVGYFGNVAGFMAFDAYQHDRARRIFRFSLSCAEEAADWHLRAKILSDMARQEMWCGDPDTALTHVEQAGIRADRLTSIELGKLASIRARALAGLRRADPARRAIAESDEAFNGAPASDGEPWLAYYRGLTRTDDSALALADLSIRGLTATAPAVDRLTAAIDRQPAGRTRSTARCRTKLATVLMREDPRQAAEIGMLAVRGAGRLRSARSADDLRELSRVAGPHAAVPEIAELRQRIRLVLTGGD
ncbi:XRE family transcriptional regulator [Goodfellowiella coeruleoviolacea]|uniref:XRE family transcriptional regulator n=1 Tax=Goodfellowiella coeruleoviolacea TaxID=334858 RepID=A0AAE3GD19_9PSEU|nr:XRE family transcriptional regulator [Goodfellowiella coeruleoviolacea]MCP2163918.1 hypothetical protein [Goodfellowiella coeruleoviolacea]